MIEGFLLCWYLLTALAIVYFLYDQISNTPPMKVMSLPWLLVILYTGPIGLFFYFISYRQPMPGTHEQFIAQHWKEAFGTQVHAVAGDATAIMAAAAILSAFALPNGVAAVIEYLAAYLFGLFIFQARLLHSFFKSYKEALRKTIFAQTASMNLVMAGMIPTILLCQGLFPAASDPGKPYFWGMISLATLIGMLFAYPMHSWMVKKKIKRAIALQAKHGYQPKPFALSPSQGWWIVSCTFVLLTALVVIVNIWVPVHFS
ncbi:MAG: DUF4396 domain-containing protein [Verrucomicrobia bacterium]|nr:DUF4396 domain-containing protein [Verrucomicrobiota bacterium]